MTPKEEDFVCPECSYYFTVEIVEKYKPEIFCPRCYKTVEKAERITEVQEIELIEEEVEQEALH